MTIALEPVVDGGSIDFNGFGIAGCAECGWRGLPVVHSGERQMICPACRVAETHEASGDRDLRVAAPDDVYGRGLSARLQLGDLFRPGMAVVCAPPTAKVGRNEPCMCGSGRKFKKCCGAAA